MKKESPIRTLRIKERLTQFQFSQVLNTNQATLSAFETGAVQVPKRILEKIAKLFKINEEKLTRESSAFYEVKRKNLRKYLGK